MTGVVPDFSAETSVDRARRARTVRGVPTAIGFFVGAGGLDLGFRTAGYRILAATDADAAAEQTYTANNPGVPFLRADIRQLRLSDIAELTGGRRPDVVIGGPPCQGFSTLGDRLSADPRNELVDAFIRLISGLQPQAVLIENVRAIATEYKGRYRDYILQQLSAIGYRANFAVLNAADYGVPQHRRRAFFVAFADPRVEFDFPAPTHGPGFAPYATVGQAIGDLIDAGPEVPNHLPLRHSDKVLARYRLIPEGGMLPPAHELPAEIRRENFGSTYKRLHRDEPSLTIVPGNNALPVHPVLNRSLTPREAARLQTLPDSYIFTGERRKQCILIGNAVPPLLARPLAQAIWERILPLRRAASRLDSVKVSAVPSVSKPLSKKRQIRSAPDLDAPGFVDLFSGVGGFMLGFARAGLQPLVCVDNNDAVAKTHRFNYPEVEFELGDLRLPDVQETVVKIAGRDPFAVVGGPPCQGFSIFGKRRLADGSAHELRSDPRNQLVFSFVDTVAQLLPRWVVMENVGGFATMDDGRFVSQVVDELRAAGYGTIEYRVLDTADYGVPQHRRRFVLIGTRTDCIIPWPKRKYFADPKDWQRPFRTVNEAIADLADEESYGKYTCHVPMNHRPLQVERYKRIPEGGRLDVTSLPPSLRQGYRTDQVKNFSHVFKRLDRNRPSSTLVPGHNAFPIHPWLNRSLTVREAARLQTFPDDIEFKGAREDQCIQVGNAFPPMLAELIVNNLLKAESNRWVPGKVPRLARYSLLDVDRDAADMEAVNSERHLSARP